jgi:hypothetical protein
MGRASPGTLPAKPLPAPALAFIELVHYALTTWRDYRIELRYGRDLSRQANKESLRAES